MIADLIRLVDLVTPPARRAWRSYKFASLNFSVFFFGVTSWATANGWYRCALLSEPRLLNSISSGICRQNTQFNMYTTTSKQQEGCTCKDSHPKCFMMTNSTAKLWPGTVNVVMCMSWESHAKVNPNTVRKYFDFIRRNGLSLAIW